jgi:hypothetical protein
MQHLFEVIEYVVIADAENHEIVSAEELISLAVVFHRLIVNCTVDLYDQSRLMAIEVSDESMNRLLATDVESTESVRTQSPP